MNIAQISSNMTGRAAGLLTAMLELNPLLRVAEFKLDTSTHIVIPDKTTHTGTAARAENAAAQRDAQAPNAISQSLALYSREVSVDDVRRLDANVGISPAGLKLFADRQLKSLAGKLADEVTTDMIAGTAANNRMRGLSEFVKDAAAAGQTAALGFTQAELAAMNINVSLQLNTDANQKAFIELLEKETAKVPGANAYICNVNLAARISTIARNIGAAGVTTDTFGRPITTINGVPVVKVPVTAITSTETDGVNNDCTSLKIVRFAEELGVAYATNSGFYFTDFDFSEVQPQGIARLQMFLQLVCERQDALLNLSRIRL